MQPVIFRPKLGVSFLFTRSRDQLPCNLPNGRREDRSNFNQFACCCRMEEEKRGATTIIRLQRTTSSSKRWWFLLD
jgi:hypothetical protein